MSSKQIRYLLIGGPGGKRLEPETVGDILIHIPKIINLGSYPFTVTALLSVIHPQDVPERKMSSDF